MDEATLKRILPRASKDTIFLNSGIPNTEPQRNKEAALGRAAQRKAQSLDRTRVRFVGYRVSPLDPDNFGGSVKDLLDGLRHAGCIEGDEWWRITLETTQEKVEHFNQEKTLIEVEFPRFCTA